MTTSRKTTLVLLGLDAFATILVFNVIGYYRGLPQRFVFLPLIGPLGLVWFAIYLVEGYRARTKLQGLDYTALHSLALVSAMCFTLLLAYVFLPYGFEIKSSRVVVILSFLTLIPVTLGVRRLVAERIVHLRSGQSLLFVGDAASQDLFRLECRQMNVTQPVIFAGGGAAQEPFAEVIRRIRAGSLSVEAIVLRESHRDLAPDTIRELVHLHFGGVPTYPLELFYQIYWRKIPLYRLNPAWLFQEGFQVAREPVFERAKRASDLALAALGLILAAPLIAIAGAAIWIEDRGPMFFRQTRIGRFSVPFGALKLRTMRPNDGRGDPYTRSNDARVTRIGRFLRRSRLDELPQLWNVLRGDMSLIGPRAEWDRLARDYERQIPCYSYRHLVKPGITGWAQVNYPYGATLEDTQRKLEYDLYYIRHFSFLLDASIVLRTIQTMLFGKGQ